MVQLEDPEKPLEWDIVRSMVDDRINQIVESTGADSLSLYLTDSKSNFRMEVATILPYKGNRKTEKPYHWEQIRQHLIDNWNAEVQYGIEADDRLGIEQMKDFIANEQWLTEGAHPEGVFGTILCSRDKDLHMIPGLHYSWECGKQKEKLWYESPETAIRHFYRQLLVGDTSDNINGLYGVGNASQLVKRIDDFDQEIDMFKHVFKAYEDRFGSYAYQFMIENGILLWMLREETVEGYPLFEDELENRFDGLMEQVNNEQ